MNDDQEKINRFSKVTLHHKLGLPDGTILEDTFEEEPLVVQLGTGELAEGLELALLELKVGDEQTIDINPDLAFGFVDESLFVDMSRDEFDDSFELVEGLIIEFATPNKEYIPGTVMRFDETNVEVDLNHPLAGEIVRYIVKIVAVDNTPIVLN